MKTYVEFRSEIFPPYDDEDDVVNPGRYGKRLAEFLIQGLASRGFRTREPIPEDWGWVIKVENPSFSLWIGCGNYDEYPDGFLCFIEPHQSVVRKFLFFGAQDTTEKVGALQVAVDEILSSEPSIREKRWSTHGEFNTQAGKLND